jgi:hypothetical protein
LPVVKSHFEQEIRLAVKQDKEASADMLFSRTRMPPEQAGPEVVYGMALRFASGKRFDNAPVKSLYFAYCRTLAPVAQVDRASVYGTEG